MLHKSSFVSISKGSTLVIALFLLVVFSAFAVVINSMKVDSADTFNSSAFYERASNAAYSSLEIATYKLFPLNIHSDNGTDRCSYARIAYETNFCKVNVECTRYSAVIDESDVPYTQINHYSLKSTADCVVGSNDSGKMYKTRKVVYSEVVNGD